METMPVKYEDYNNSTTAAADMLLAEDIWRKVEDDYSDIFCSAYFEDFNEELSLDNPLDSLFAQVEEEERRQGLTGMIKVEHCDEVLLTKHDCMWGGHCGSSEHPDDLADAKLPWPILGTGATAPIAAPVASKGIVPYAPAQQSLLKPSLRSAGLPVLQMVTPGVITPQTPPMSDDEDKHNIKQTQVLKIFPTPEDYDDDADRELSEYFGEPLYVEDEQKLLDEEESSSSSSSSSSSESEEDEPQPGPSTSYTSHNVTSIMSNVYATENDHSYHKDKNASMRMASLGIDTPSDSEEEIDVVSVSDKKHTDASRMGYALPTNPSVSDRRHLQKTMESAMNTGRRPSNTSNGLKIMLPTKRPVSSGSSNAPAKRRANATNENRSNKRTRQYRMTNPTTYRRRGQYGHDSESEPEPSEKRNLHNNMERQRRIDLRNAFEYLRQLVPEVLKKERAAKVVILREAAKYCDHLTYQSMSINRQVEDLKRHQERLRMRVSMLRRNLALKR